VQFINKTWIKQKTWQSQTWYDDLTWRMN